MTNSKNSNHSAAHTKLKNEILAVIGIRQDFLVIPTVSGLFRSMFGERVIDAGRDKPDIIGTVAPNGRCVGIEVKTGKGKQTDGQIKWQIAFEKRGGFYAVVRSIEDAVNAIDQSKKNM